MASSSHFDPVLETYLYLAVGIKQRKICSHSLAQSAKRRLCKCSQKSNQSSIYHSIQCTMHYTVHSCSNMQYANDVVVFIHIHRDKYEKRKNVTECRSVVECNNSCRWYSFRPFARRNSLEQSHSAPQVKPLLFLILVSYPVVSTPWYCQKPLHSMPDIFMLPELPLPDRFLNPSFMPIFFQGFSVRVLGL